MLNVKNGYKRVTPEYIWPWRSVKIAYSYSAVHTRATLANETLPRAPSNGLPIGNPHVAGDTLHLRVIGLRHDDAFPALRTRDKREIIISAPKSILWGFQKNHCFVITCTLDAHILNNYFYGFHTSWFAKTPECSL